jgi:hypothetical protein
MALPPSRFAAAFRHHVLPAIAVTLETHALFLALDLESWSDALDAILTPARRRGFYWLPQPHQDALLDWVEVELLRLETEAFRQTERHERRFAHVHADIDRWNDAVLRG